MEDKPSFADRAAELGGKIGQNVYLQSVSQGMMPLLPIIIIGSFASLFSGLPVEAWQGFIQSTGIAGLLSMVVAATTKMLGVYFCYGITLAFAEKRGITGNKLLPILGIVVYLILQPGTITSEEGQMLLPFSYLGTEGMIVGILISFATVLLYQAIVDANITIKMPDGTPDYVSRSFVSLIPAFVVTIAAMVVRGLFVLTPWGNIFDCINQLLQAPLMSIIGDNVISMCVMQVLTQLLWVFGVHPGFISSLTGPILFGLDGMNQAAYAAGEAVPNIIGMAFSYSTTIAVVYPALAVALLIASRSARLKTVGKVALAPAVFGISEPMIFGIPVLLNPIIAIPWVIAPVMNFVLGYIACSTGIVATYAGVTVFNFPMIVTGLLNGDVSIAIMEAVLFALDVALFLPFVRATDKGYLNEETSERDAA